MDINFLVYLELLNKFVNILFCYIPWSVCVLTMIYLIVKEFNSDVL